MHTSGDPSRNLVDLAKKSRPRRRGGCPLDGTGASPPPARALGVPAWEWWRHTSTAILDKYIEVYLSLKESLKSAIVRADSPVRVASSPAGQGQWTALARAGRSR